MQYNPGRNHHARTSTPLHATSARGRTWRQYLHHAAHLGLMIVLMYVGMFTLDPVYDLIMHAAGASDPWSQLPILSNFVMASNMTIPMVTYMILKRHRRRVIGEMSTAMFIPAVILLGPYLYGLITTETMMSLSHSAMIPLMTAVTIYRICRNGASPDSGRPTSADTSMSAAVYRRFGGPDIVHVENVARPSPRRNEVLVRVEASTVSAADRRARSRDVPKGLGLLAVVGVGLFWPRPQVLGMDIAGVIEAIGSRSIWIKRD